MHARGKHDRQRAMDGTQLRQDPNELSAVQIFLDDAAGHLDQPHASEGARNEGLGVVHEDTVFEAKFALAGPSRETPGYGHMTPAREIVDCEMATQVLDTLRNAEPVEVRR